jgi:hypothetical protein
VQSRVRGEFGDHEPGRVQRQPPSAQLLDREQTGETRSAPGDGERHGELVERGAHNLSAGGRIAARKTRGSTDRSGCSGSRTARPLATSRSCTSAV